MRGAHVLTMDASLGDLASGDVHVRDGAIVAVAASVPAPGAEVIDGRGMICMPGLIDTHWHHWTNVCRAFVRNDDPKLGYFPVTAKYGPHYQPEDSYRSARLGLAEALSAGITTTQQLVAQRAQPGPRRRARFAPCATSASAAASPTARRSALPNEQPMDLADLARAKREWTSGRRHALARHLLAQRRRRHRIRRAARSRSRWPERNGARRASSACRSRCTPRVRAITKLLDDAGLLGPDVQFVHPMNTAAEDRVDPGGQGRQLLDLADRRIAPALRAAT